MKTVSIGKCRICGKEINRSGITRHLASCVGKIEMTEGIPEKEELFEIFVSDHYMKEYWLVIEVSGKAKLKTLDRFLRSIWCECCGHLSRFSIGGVNYESNPSPIYSFWGNTGEKGMDITLNKVLDEGLKFRYIYDFGSSTELDLTVKGIRVGSKKGKDEIRLLARNDMPKLVCSLCNKKKASYINPFANYYDDIVFLCSDCVSKIEEGEFEEEELEEVDADALLPVCNSPRMGVCGYTGELDDWD